MVAQEPAAEESIRGTCSAVIAYGQEGALTFDRSSYRRYDMGWPWRFPVYEVSGVLTSAWASTHTTLRGPAAAA